ncbi:hypothetical protein [Streptomyces sp. NPDC059080]|uniref:hypothetical protein n=1 Tax=Streptomyces sp. NPDC059080 TaxID=3346718 RepID=UPI0036B7754A
MPKHTSELTGSVVPSLAARVLTDGLRAAGISAQASITPDGEITLSPLSEGQVELFAEHLRPDLLPVVDELREVLEAHGIRARPTVAHGRIYPGAYSMADVDTLAIALGGPAQPGLDQGCCPDWPAAHDACCRLEAASAEAIGHRLRGDLRPYCASCDRDVALKLLPLESGVTRRLTEALNRAASRAPRT